MREAMEKVLIDRLPDSIGPDERNDLLDRLTTCTEAERDTARRALDEAKAEVAELRAASERVEMFLDRADNECDSGLAEVLTDDIRDVMLPIPQPPHRPDPGGGQVVRSPTLTSPSESEGSNYAAGDATC